MPANNLPKMPPAPVTDAVLGPLYSRHDLQAYGHTCYLVGIEAAKNVARDTYDPYQNAGVNFEELRANLDALGRE